MSSFIIDYSWLHELVLYGRDAELSAAITGNWDIIEAIWDLEEKHAIEEDSSFFGGENWTARLSMPPRPSPGISPTGASKT